MSETNIGDTESKLYERNKQSTSDLLDLLLKHHGQREIKAADDQQARLLEKQFVPVDADQEDSEPLEICILPIPSPRITVDYIKRVVCKHYGISHNDLVSPRRDRTVARPRMIATYLCREYTAQSFPYIARKFHRDHTSSLSAFHRVREWIETDPDVAADVQTFSEMLSA